MCVLLLSLCAAAHYSTLQYSTVQYSKVQYSTVQYSTVLYSTVQYSTVQYSTVHFVLFGDVLPSLCAAAPSNTRPREGRGRAAAGAERWGQAGCGSGGQPQVPPWGAAGAAGVPLVCPHSHIHSLSAPHPAPYGAPIVTPTVPLTLHCSFGSDQTRFGLVLSLSHAKQHCCAVPFVLYFLLLCRAVSFRRAACST